MNRAGVYDSFKSSLFALLDEFFEGPPPVADGTYALDRAGSFRHTLAGVSAADASRSAFQGATTVAAQVIHTTYYLTNLLRYLEPSTAAGQVADWPGSWARSVVDAAEWDAARAELFAAYLEVKRAIGAMTDWSGDQFIDAMVPLAHSAYHLGAIRQLTKALTAN